MLYDRLDPDQFGHSLTGAIAPVAVQAPAGFSAKMWHSSSGRQSAGRILAAPHRTEGRAGISRDQLVCSVLLSGSATISQGGRTHRVRTGDAWWFRTGSDYVLTFDDEVELIGVAMTPHRVPLMGASVSGVADGEDPLLSVLFSVIDGLERGMSSASAPLQSRMLDHIFDVVETVARRAVLEQLPYRPSSLLVEALDAIDAMIADPDLSPRSIADALHISVRALHSAFAGTAMTVSGVVRAKRLERCRQDLADPLLGTWRVADIGARWGFAAHSHFTAAFRAAYGITPSAYREQHRLEAALSR